MKIKYILIVSAGLFLQNAAAQSKNEIKSNSVEFPKSFQADGIWRGVFNLKPGVEVPFNFEIKNRNGDQPFLSFLNADERFDGGVVKRKGDSLLINLDQFDNVLSFKIQKDSLVGVLKRQDGSGKPLPVYASKAKQYRFATSGQAPDADISGKYDIVFQSQNGKNENAVGLFKQTGNKITGTFLRITGD
ncbi:MAG: hypothetical protein EOO45_10920, partial [Flavobacterium sp.]